MIKHAIHEIPFVMNGIQLQMYDAIHSNKNVNITIPRQCGSTTLLSYIMHLYKHHNILAIAPTTAGSKELRNDYKFVNSRVSLNHKFIGCHSNKWMINHTRLDMIIIDQYDYCAFDAVDKNQLDMASNNPNLRSILVSTSNKNSYKTTPININSFMFK